MRFRLLCAIGALWTPVLAAQAPAEPAALGGARASAVLWVPALRDAAADSQRVAAWLERCGVSSARLARRPDAPSVDGGVLAFVVTPRARETRGCEDNSSERLAPMWGVQLADDSTGAGAAIGAITILRDGTPVRLAGASAIAVERWGGDSAGRGTVGARLVYLAFDALQPSPTGTFGAVQLIATFAGDPRPDTIRVDGIALRAAWESALALRGTGAAARATMRVPTARDADIAAAQAEAERGAHAAAVRALVGKWRRPGLTRDDRRAAAAQLGASLYAVGDDAGARVAFYALLEEMPCLTLAADVPESLRALVDAVQRPAVRCTEQSLTRTALRAAVLPGFGRPRTPGERLFREPIAGLMVVGLVAAVMAEQEARTSYTEYLDYQAEVVDPRDFRYGADYWYRRAERARSLQNNIWIGLAGAWVAQNAFAVWQERRLHRALEAQRGYGRSAPAVGLRLRALENGTSVGVEVRW